MKNEWNSGTALPEAKWNLEGGKGGVRKISLRIFFIEPGKLSSIHLLIHSLENIYWIPSMCQCLRQWTKGIKKPLPLQNLYSSVVVTVESKCNKYIVFFKAKSAREKIE